MTQRVSDEELMAYADGELTGVRADAIAQACRDDETIARQVERLRRQRSLLRRAFGDEPNAPVSPAIGQLLDAPDRGEPRRAAASRRATAGRSRIGRGPGWPRPAMALAASLALVAVLGAGYGIGRWHGAATTPTPLQVQAQIDAALGEALETRGNGAAFQVDLPAGTSVEVEPRTTFIDGSGRFCRTYDLTLRRGADSVTQAGWACRHESGRWTAETRDPPGALPAASAI
jgi:anti-sigma factor RsiW